MQNLHIEGIRLKNEGIGIDRKSLRLRQRKVSAEGDLGIVNHQRGGGLKKGPAVKQTLFCYHCLWLLVICQP